MSGPSPIVTAGNQTLRIGGWVLADFGKKAEHPIAEMLALYCMNFEADESLWKVRLDERHWFCQIGVGTVGIVPTPMVFCAAFGAVDSGFSSTSKVAGTDNTLRSADHGATHILEALQDGMIPGKVSSVHLPWLFMFYKVAKDQV